ncbi:GGDEF domain-containing protein [Shewanella yunxiaonensis]|uniref:diguanylate cyclase n=1 Tax=Shewanella yunxiaonensis TaxID=2829809 RepID=A0ABX7YRQ9_9GAMM|nr:GGDEF domain-containing protein [Shewanella yunxiaonensis]QUN04866.1 GGDEF domain-containing protein [Shewanella yunxiaonensis]
MDYISNISGFSGSTEQWRDESRHVSEPFEPLQLLQKLHSSLDPRTVFACYGKHLQRDLPLYGIYCKCGDIELRWGRMKGIKLTHEIQLGDDIAQLEYCLPMPLSLGESLLLQQVEALLPQPLFNAARYQKMASQAMFDALTGLGNRHFFGQAFRTVLARAQRNRNQVSLLLMDLDNFKLLNDNKGHHYGDQALVRFGEIVHRCIRRCDQPFRLGGDEFAVLVEGDASAAVSIAGRVLQHMQTEAIFNQHNVGCSMGIGNWQPLLNQDQLFNKTDAALYRAKSAGRNGYAIAD